MYFLLFCTYSAIICQFLMLLSKSVWDIKEKGGTPRPPVGEKWGKEGFASLQAATGQGHQLFVFVLLCREIKGRRIKNGSAKGRKKTLWKMGRDGQWIDRCRNQLYRISRHAAFGFMFWSRLLQSKPFTIHCFKKTCLTSRCCNNAFSDG